MTQTVAELIELMNSNNEDWLDISRTLINIGEPAVMPLIESLSSQNALRRSDAALILGNIGDHRAIQPLLNQLNDEAVSARCTAIIALSSFAEAGIYERIVVYLDDKEEDIRSYAADALGYLGDERAILPLMNRIEVEEDSQVREDIIVSLGRFKNPVCLPLLSWLSKNDPNDFVRITAYEILGQWSSSNSENL